MRGRRLLNGPAEAGRRLLTLALLFLVILALLGFVVISPFFLAPLNDQTTDWSKLSDIGQTYGAASAVLAAFALTGVALSLILQAREAKASRGQTLRALHTDLMRMAMEDPVYRACWGSFFTSDNTDEQRAHMYVNMIVNHWLMMWELRPITEAHLRSIAGVVLAGPISWRFWTDARQRRLLSAATWRERHFNRILDEVYRTVPAPSLPASKSSPTTARRTGPTPAQCKELLLLGLGLLVVFAPVLRRLLRRSHPGREPIL